MGSIMGTDSGIYRNCLCSCLCKYWWSLRYSKSRRRYHGDGYPISGVVDEKYNSGCYGRCAGYLRDDRGRYFEWKNHPTGTGNKIRNVFTIQRLLPFGGRTVLRVNVPNLWWTSQFRE